LDEARFFVEGLGRRKYTMNTSQNNKESAKSCIYGTSSPLKTGMSYTDEAGKSSTEINGGRDRSLIGGVFHPFKVKRGRHFSTIRHEESRNSLEQMRFESS